MPGPSTPAPNAEWTVTPESVATISESGLLTALRTGVVTVRASVGEVTGPPTVITVIQPTGPLVIEPESLTVVPGSDFEVFATLADSHGVTIPGLTPVLLETDETVLRSTGGLRFHAQYPGTAKVVACMASRTDTAFVTVVDPSLSGRPSQKAR